ncbi:MAG: ArsR/SmtB family transcription factor [Actinomycetota bacterium]
MAVGRPAIVEAAPLPLAETELVARLFRALGDSTRLRILELLADDGELHQSEIVARLGASQGRVSEHLACLVWCGFVVRRVEGRRAYYRIAGREVRDLLGRARRFLERNEAQVASCRRIDAEEDVS